MNSKIFASRVVYKINEALFKKAAIEVRKTRIPDFYNKSHEVKIVTQLHHDAVDMYLLAIKSFLLNAYFGEIHIINDGSLTNEDLALLHQHLPNFVLIDIASIDTASCPKGGTWERLLYIIDLSQTAYVIQLDSDTLTLGVMPEVHDAIRNQHGFTINHPAWNRPVDAGFVSRAVKNWIWVYESGSFNVQVAAEQVFDQLDFFADGKKYIRGCSAFAGFPKQQINRDMAVDFSKQISAQIGEQKWSEWGSEQVMSNILVAQTHNPLALPWPRYQNYKLPKTDKYSVENASLIHFIGTNRFSDRNYEKLATRFIRSLKQ